MCIRDRPKEQEPVTKRVIHTSADFDYAETMCYSDHAVEIAKELILKGADIVTVSYTHLDVYKRQRICITMYFYYTDTIKNNKGNWSI